MYIARCKRWSWHNNQQIVVKKNILTEWQTYIFYFADGHYTIEEMIEKYPSHWQDKSKVPLNFKDNLLNAVQKLLEMQYIKHWNKADALEYRYLISIEEYNADEEKEYDS